MKDDNYITVQGWMVNRLKLSGNELIVYAIIYGFSQDAKSVYKGSISYISESVGVSRQSICEILKKLVEKGLLIKIGKTGKGLKFSDYKAVLPDEECKESLHECKESLHSDVKKVYIGCKESLHHNINNIADNTFINSSSKKPKRKRDPTPFPTLLEIQEYFREKSLTIVPEVFFEYYTETVVAAGQKPWTDKNGKEVKNWKLKAQTWQRFQGGNAQGNKSAIDKFMERVDQNREGEL